jgi:hypothetical protein
METKKSNNRPKNPFGKHIEKLTSVFRKKEKPKSEVQKTNERALNEYNRMLAIIFGENEIKINSSTKVPAELSNAIRGYYLGESNSEQGKDQSSSKANKIYELLRALYNNRHILETTDNNVPSIDIIFKNLISKLATKEFSHSFTDPEELNKLFYYLSTDKRTEFVSHFSPELQAQIADDINQKFELILKRVFGEAANQFEYQISSPSPNLQEYFFSLERAKNFKPETSLDSKQTFTKYAIKKLYQAYKDNEFSVNHKNSTEPENIQKSVTLLLTGHLILFTSEFAPKAVENLPNETKQYISTLLFISELDQAVDQLFDFIRSQTESSSTSETSEQVVNNQGAKPQILSLKERWDQVPLQNQIGITALAGLASLAIGAGAGVIMEGNPHAQPDTSNPAEQINQNNNNPRPTVFADQVRTAPNLGPNTTSEAGVKTPDTTTNNPEQKPTEIKQEVSKTVQTKKETAKTPDLEIKELQSKHYNLADANIQITQFINLDLQKDFKLNVEKIDDNVYLSLKNNPGLYATVLEVASRMGYHYAFQINQNNDNLLQKIKKDQKEFFLEAYKQGIVEKRDGGYYLSARRVKNLLVNEQPGN